MTHRAESDAPYENADYYRVEDLADWLHPWLEGRPFCAFSPKTLCPHTRRSMDMARALLCEDGWIEGFMYHRLTRVLPPASTCCADHDDCHLSGELICCDRCPDIERCACGHGWHQHDPEAVPPICMACGDAERCVTQPAPCPTCEHPEGYDRLSGPCPTCQGTGVMPPEGGKP